MRNIRLHSFYVGYVGRQFVIVSFKPEETPRKVRANSKLDFCGNFHNQLSFSSDSSMRTIIFILVSAVCFIYESSLKIEDICNWMRDHFRLTTCTKKWDEIPCWNSVIKLTILEFQVCPGWVQTDMGGPSAHRTPDEGKSIVHSKETVFLSILAFFPH